MPVVRVFLRCATPTNRPGGDFDTFITVSQEGLERGEHITQAMRRASILGFAGPCRVTEVRRLDAPRLSISEIRAHLAELANPRRRRWLAMVDQCQELAATNEAIMPPANSPRSHGTRSRSRR